MEVDDTYSTQYILKFDRNNPLACIGENEWIDYNSLFEVINGCDSIFYTASPLSNDLTCVTIFFIYRNKSKK